MILAHVVLILILQTLPGSSSEQNTIIKSCDEVRVEAKQSREEQNLEKEIAIWERAIQNECKSDSKAFSQLALCYLEAGDQSYSDRGSKDVEARKRLFKQALQASTEAAKLDPTNKYAFERKSMAFAGMVDIHGLRKKAQLADSVRINAEIALELDPKNDRALHILGRWHYEVSQISGFLKFLSRLVFGTAPKGSFEKAEEYFKRASEIEDFPVHHYWLGITYVKLKKKEKAKEHLEHLLTIENQHHNDEFFKEQAVEALKKIK